MLTLPPLDSLRFFEAAARHQSFAHAADELGVTAAAVAQRVRTLEKHLDARLFERRSRSVRLNPKGHAYLKEVQRILADVHGVSERQRLRPRRVRIVSVEAVAQKWLVPRLASFKAGASRHRHRARDQPPGRRPGPARLRRLARLHRRDRRAAPGDAARGHASGGDAVRGEPVAGVQPGLCWRRGAGRAIRPTCTAGRCSTISAGTPTGRTGSRARERPTPDLSQASGFRLYSMLVEAAVNGLGAAVGRPMLIARELERRTLVPLFERLAEAPERCCLITTAASRQRPEVQAFREWILEEATSGGRRASDGLPRHP